MVSSVSQEAPADEPAVGSPQPASEEFALGGQAVIEGVMMRSPNHYAVAVRRESGEIIVHDEQAISIVKENGKVVIVAVFEKAPEIEWNLVVRKGVRLFGSWAWSPEELVQASRLINSGEIDRKPLISHTFSLEDAREAYETQLREEEAIKVLLTP